MTTEHKPHGYYTDKVFTPEDMDKAIAAERERINKEFPVKFCSVKAFEDWCSDIRRNERELCAQLCEDQWQTAHDIQDAIRARGNP